ncbi:MAG TPA: DegT/DnrJ/EryC1/StrS family aminotransferase [Chthoniobacterales bacterium]|nr:DegT/DnrJ/EryC1/StrS family aminotransferase [Chthoniobacterales bacterium]
MILQNDFKRQWDEVAEKVLGAVRRVGSSGWYILGAEVAAFEKELAAGWGVAHAIGTANGLDALEIGLRCLGLRPGDKVLTTPLSAFATTLAILRADGVPVFVDVDATGGIDLAQCRQILARDRSIRFLLPVHLYGHALDMDELRKLRRDFELNLLEDCAQAIGANRVGTAGHAAATSFYPTKNLGALGDAGAILTNDPAIAQAASEMRNYGQSAHYVNSRLGLNSRLDELHAAILRDAFLPHLTAWTQARRQIAEKYLAGIRHSAIAFAAPAAVDDSVWHLFPMLVKDREKFREHLRGRGITTGVHYPCIIPEQSALSATTTTKSSPAEFPSARRFARDEVSLPIHPFLTAEEVETVIAACNSWEEP